MNKLSILKTELALPAYSAMTDAECLTALTTADIPKKIDISARDIQKYLALQNKLMALEASATDSAKAAVRYLELFDSFSMDDPEVETALTGILDALVTDSLITATDKTNILAMGSKMISRAEEIGVGNVKLGWIEQARV